MVFCTKYQKNRKGFKSCFDYAADLTKNNPADNIIHILNI